MCRTLFSKVNNKMCLVWTIIYYIIEKATVCALQIKNMKDILLQTKQNGSGLRGQCQYCQYKSIPRNTWSRFNEHMWHSLGKWPKMHFLAKMSYYHFHVPCWVWSTPIQFFFQNGHFLTENQLFLWNNRGCQKSYIFSKNVTRNSCI